MKILRILTIIPALFIFTPVSQAAPMPKECAVDIPTNDNTKPLIIGEHDKVRFRYNFTTTQIFFCNLYTTSSVQHLDKASISYTDAKGHCQTVWVTGTDAFVQLFGANFPPTTKLGPLVVPKGDIIVENLGNKGGKNGLTSDDFTVVCGTKSPL